MSLFVSYRPAKSNGSVFLNVDTLVNDKDTQLINSVYSQLSFDVFRYIKGASNNLKSLKKLNETLYGYYKKQNLENVKLESQEITPEMLHHKIDKAMENAKKSTRLPNEIKNVLNERADDLNLEFQRLIQNPRNRKIAAERGVKEKGNKIDKWTFVNWARTVELQQRLGNKYLVLNHGQESTYLITNMVYTSLMKYSEGIRKENQHLLRFPQLLENREISSYKEEIRSFQKKSISKKLLKKEVNDTLYAKDLLSVDCYLENRSNHESAWYFSQFSPKRGMIGVQMNEFNEIDHIKRAFQACINDQRVIKDLCNIMKDLIDEVALKDKYPIGHFYSILVPKSSFEEIGYVSKPYGIPYDDSDMDLEDLSAMQNGNKPKKDKHYPQVRLSALKVATDPEVITLLSCSYPKEEIRALEYTIDLVIKQALFLRPLSK